MSSIQDPLTRAMLWQSLWDLVRDGEMSALEYSNTVIRHIGSETDLRILERVGRTIYSGYTSLMVSLPDETSEAKAIRKSYLQKFEEFSWKQANAKGKRSEIRKFWFESFLRTVATKDGLKNAHDVLTAKKWIRGLKMDQDLRWKVIFALSSNGFQLAPNLREKELQRDPTEKGQKMALASQASHPSPALKRSWLKRIISRRSDLSLARRKSIMRSLFPSRQASLKRSIQEEFFAELPRLAKEKEDEFLKTYSRHLVPILCNQQSTERLNEYLSSHQNLPPVVLKNLRVNQQENERCVRIRKKILSELRAKKKIG